MTLHCEHSDNALSRWLNRLYGTSDGLQSSIANQTNDSPASIARLAGRSCQQL